MRSLIDRVGWRVVLIGLTLFVVFLYLRFPVGAFKGRLENSLSGVMPGSHVAIGRMSTTLLPGVVLRNVTITSTSDPRLRLVLKKLKLRLGFSALFLRKIKVVFSLQSKGIVASGSFSKGFWGRDVLQSHLAFSRLDLSQFFVPGYLANEVTAFLKQQIAISNPQLGGMTSALKLKGMIKGEFSLSGGARSVRAFDLSSVALNVSLKSRGLVLEELVPGALKLGAIHANFDLEEGEGKLRRFTVKGADLEGDGSGTLRLEKAPKPGNIDMKFKFNVPKTANKTLAGTLNMVLMPLGLEAKNGSIGFRVSGVLNGRIPPRILPLKN